MGCDIHLQVERRVNGEWERVPHPDRPCDYEYCEGGTLNDKVPNEKMRGTACYHCGGSGRTVEEFWSDRNYDVFAILADVRNGSGFAGVDTGDGFVPISLPKGLPDDLSKHIYCIVNDRAEWCDPCGTLRPKGTTKPVTFTGRDEKPYTYDAEVCPECGREFESYTYCQSQSFWLGDHSFSFLTVAEILDYDWERTTTKRGTVTVEQAREFALAGEPPSSWCGWTSDSTAQQIEWPVTYREVAARFLRVFERDIVPLGRPSDVRLVFGFDS